MWFSKKQEIDIVTIPTAAWANNTASDVFNKQANKDTRDLLKHISAMIKNESFAGEMSLSIDSKWLEIRYKTPRWVLCENVEKALTPYGYKVTRGSCLNYYINIKWGDEPKCTDFNFTKPTTKPSPGPKKDDGE